MDVRLKLVGICPLSQSNETAIAVVTQQIVLSIIVKGLLCVHSSDHIVMMERAVMREILIYGHDGEFYFGYRFIGETFPHDIATQPFSRGMADHAAERISESFACIAL